jgi:ketosteroid isomerase-like protein
MNAQVIQKVYEAFNRKDYSTVLESFDRDMEWYAAEHSPLADQSPYRGLDQIRKGVFDRIQAGFEYLTVQTDEMISAENKVVALGYYHGLLKGKEKPFRAQLAHVWTIREDRIIKFQQYLDTYQVAQAVK